MQFPLTLGGSHVALNYPNIVPENNLRLPDALTIKHGPAPLLSRFVLESDRQARNLGVRLRIRYDFDELLRVNERETATGSWYKLPIMFDPRHADLSPENSYWISGENEDGEIVLTQAGRIYYWPDTSLCDEARLMFFGGRDEGQQCEVTAPIAQSITGVVFYGGALWLHPDLRRRFPAGQPGRIGRAYAAARWPVDWSISFMSPALVEKGHAARCGFRHAGYSIKYPASPWGDLEFAITGLSALEAYDDFTSFLEGDDSTAAPSSDPRRRADNEINVSPLGVRQGSRSLS
jgi:hypothetical protein